MDELINQGQQAPVESAGQRMDRLEFAEFCRITGAAPALRSTFDDVAASYDRFRPGYPSEVIDDVFELGNLAEGSHVLEVGCGTGQATRSLAYRGLKVDAIELSPSMAAFASSNLESSPNVEIHVADFEEWTPRTSYDAVVAFTSFHLVDPARGYAAVRRSLRKGGQLVLVCTFRVVSNADLFGARAASIFSSASPGMAEASALEAAEIWTVAGSHRADMGELLSALMGVPLFHVGQWFGPCALRRRVWSQTYTARSYVELLSTYSTCNIVPESQRQSIFDQVASLIDLDFGGSVNVTFLNVVAAAMLLNP